MKTVLLTDDNQDMIDLVQLILAKSGYDLKVAKSGEEAIKTCMESAPDLVLMDLRMPDMDGITAIKTLRTKGFNKPIIVLTASESDEDRQAAAAAGSNDFIIKSMEMRELEPAIDVYLQSGGGLE